jgi:hypothetical protein
MTRDQQIRKALELLAPPPGDRPECQHDIGLALNRVESGATAARSFRVAGSKKGKAGLRRYCSALRRLRTAYRSLDPAIRPWFSLAETAYVVGKPTVIDREIANAEAFLNRPSPPPRRDASRNKAAVAASYDLLQWWGHKAAATRGGKWAQLAKILASSSAAPAQLSRRCGAQTRSSIAHVDGNRASNNPGTRSEPHLLQRLQPSDGRLEHH